VLGEIVGFLSDRVLTMGFVGLSVVIGNRDASAAEMGVGWQEASLPLMETRGRFALLCQHFFPELISTGLHMTELATRLQAVGWQVSVVCAQPTLSLESANMNALKRTDHEGVEVRRVHAFGSHRNLFARAAFSVSFLMFVLVDVIRHRGVFDGIVVTTNPPFLGLVCRVLKSVTGLRYVVIVYDVYPDLLAPLGVLGKRSLGYRAWDWVTRLILRGADKIVVIGRDMRELIVAKVPDREADIEVIPNWSDERVVQPIEPEMNRFRSEHLNGASFLVQYSGRMARTHNIEPILEAAHLLRDRPVLFQFIGDGAKKPNLEARAVELGLQNISFLPYQPSTNLAQVLSAADLAVVCLDMPFTGMSVPSKAYGIMATGTPILGLVDDRSEIGRMVGEYECGVILPDASAADVAETVERLMADRDELERLGANSRDAFLSQFSLAIAAGRYDELLRAVFH
jgi:glycosyltransferase involved in cell wall biosynthesis